jgi:hypothetical protein
MSGYDIRVKVKDGVPYVMKKTMGELYASWLATKDSLIPKTLGLDERPIAISKTAWNKMKADRVVTLRFK